MRPQRLKGHHEPVRAGVLPVARAKMTEILSFPPASLAAATSACVQAGLLLSAAIAYDTQFATKRSKRQVFNHEFCDQNEDGTLNGDSFDIETPVTTLQAYAAMINQSKSNPNYEMKPRLSKEKWYALSEKERLVWDQLDDKAKGIILGIGDQRSQTNVRFHGKISKTGG